MVPAWQFVSLDQDSAPVKLPTVVSEGGIQKLPQESTEFLHY